MAKRPIRTRQSKWGRLHNHMTRLNKWGFRIIKMQDDETFEQRAWRLGKRRVRISN